jgi:hypothetical protein
MTTLTLVPKAPLTIEHPRRPLLLARLVEGLVHIPMPSDRAVDQVLARAIDEAFESLAREARS